MLMLPDGFIPRFNSPTDITAPVQWFVFAGNRLLVHQLDDDRAAIPQGLQAPVPEADVLRHLTMGDIDGQACCAVEVAKDYSPPEGMQFSGLRDLWGMLDDGSIGLAGQAIQIIDWDRCHQFCGRCGEAMIRRDNERAKHCPACGLSHYPRLAPAAMMRIVRDDAILLARSPRFPPDRFSVLAGFVDPGETLEQAIHREVMEEVGLTIKNLRYFTSQAWPFPHSLMLAFTADYAGGEIRLEDDEIAEADWFTPDNLPGLPPPISIARKLIDDYLDGL